MPQSFAEQLRSIPMSPSLGQSLERAHRSARDQSHRFVTLEHLLLALTEDAEAGLILQAANVDLARLGTDVSGYLGRLMEDMRAEPGWEPRPDGELLRVLQAHANVVLWLNGHIHANRITPRESFWEVTTSSLVDWPCQARLVQIHHTRSGQLAIACAMLDHDGEGLAGLHRELAGNVPNHGFDSWRPGRPWDRNAVLLLADPLG